MRVLVTGGAGWIGRHVIAQLELEGYTPRAFDWQAGLDIRNDYQVQAAIHDVDAVIHLAGVLGTHELFDSPRLAVTANVLGSLNVLEACRKHGARYVGISMPDVNPSLYAATKVCAQRMAAAYADAYDIPVCHVVAYNAYGPGQAYGPGHPQKIIPTFATKGWAGEALPVWGDGRLWVDLIHVEDVARILVAGLKSEGVLHAGTGTPVEVRHVAERIIEWTGGRSKIDWLPARRGERRESTSADVAPRGTATFSWDRLRETVEWYR